MDKIIIVDFGSQTTQLIGRRIREAGVYSEIVGWGRSPEDIDWSGVKGIIFSGSPESVYAEGAPVISHDYYERGLPILGICYGFQRMTADFGGDVKPHKTREFGRSAVTRLEESPLLDEIPEGFLSWMSHGDSIAAMGRGFELSAKSQNGFPAVARHREKNLWGLQFHPEVTHCEYGTQILANFALKICGAKPEWTMDRYIEEVCESIRRKTGKGKVLLLISGGVDSTVTAGILLKALDPSQVHLMYIDNGLMRKDETLEVEKTLGALGARHIHIIDAEERFLTPLQGVIDPEEKRKIIGDRFIQVQTEEVERLAIGEAFLAQGTLYTDLIESGKGVGSSAHVIKSHHNVGTPLVMEKREKGLLIEPLDCLYKDEVRLVGEKLGINPQVVHRHPFPGPGLGIRILGEVSKERCDLLREADHIYIEELRKRGLYDKIWQAFSVLLPVRSVGVAGDARHYGWVLSLRAVISRDGMTADVFPFPPQDLLEISSRITNEVAEIGRVVYDISSKPPSTIEWE